MDDHDALHAARAIFSGRRSKIRPDEVFNALALNPRFDVKDIIDRRRSLEAFRIGAAVAAVGQAKNKQADLRALLHLARVVRPHLTDKKSGWFRFLLKLAKNRDDIPFQLSFLRRPESKSAQPPSNLKRQTQTRQAMSDMAVAGAILFEIGEAKARGASMPIKAAIEAAILSGAIATQEEAANQAWQRFRKHCRKLTGGDTYRLKKYTGTLKSYQGRWVALPDAGVGALQLPSAKGGRPKT